MYVLEYLIYHLKPFGVRNTLSGTAPPPPDRDLNATPWPGPTDEDERKKKEAEAEEKRKEEELKKQLEEDEAKRKKAASEKKKDWKSSRTNSGQQILFIFHQALLSIFMSSLIKSNSKKKWPLFLVKPFATCTKGQYHFVFTFQFMFLNEIFFLFFYWFFIPSILVIVFPMSVWSVKKQMIIKSTWFSKILTWTSHLEWSTG